MSSLQVAVLGLGRAGRFHLESLRTLPNVDIGLVYDTDKGRSSHVAAEYGCAATETLQQAVNAPCVDAVIVATPTDAHEETVLAALEAGKPVLTEKPLARQVSEIDSCFRLAEQQGLPLFVAFQRRFDSSFSELIRAARANELGQLQFIRSVSRDNPVPSTEYLKISGGIYHDCIVHDLDMICQIAGERPVEVAAFGSSFIESIRQLDDHDNVVASVAFPSGLLASIDVSRRCAFGYDQRIEVFGEAGMLLAENQHRTSVTSATAHGFSRAPIEYSFPTRYLQAYRDEMACFLACVRGESKVPVTHADVRLNHLLASALESAARERRVIRLDEPSSVLA